MVFRQDNDKYFLRFDYGEEFITALKTFLLSQNIDGAWFYGLGGALSATLGMYRIDSDKEYHWHDFAGPLEVTNITGNVAVEDDELAIHAHATISGVDYKASGGHIKELIVAGTLELVLERTGRLERKYDHDVGLGLMDLGE